MASKTKNTLGQERKMQEERVKRNQQFRLLMNAAKDFFGMTRQEPDLYAMQHLFELDDRLAHISTSILGPEEGRSDQRRKEAIQLEQAEKDSRMPKKKSGPQSTTYEQQTPPRRAAQASHLLERTTSTSSALDSDMEGWTLVKGRKRCAKKAAGDTPERPSGMSGAGRPLTLTELKKSCPKKVGADFSLLQKTAYAFQKPAFCASTSRRLIVSTDWIECW
jgi:hypothetical protein